MFTIPSAVTNNTGVFFFFRFLAGESPRSDFDPPHPTNSYSTRFLTGLAASAPMTNAAGSIGDVWSINERGHKMAAFSSILFASPWFVSPAYRLPSASSH